jgi:hypothetical protein
MLKKVTGWLGKRAKEKSTYTGVAIIATVLGADKLGVTIDQVGTAVTMIVGGGLIAAPTKD